MFSDGPISWSSKKQKCVALSTAETKYVALSGADQECLWLRQLEVELGCLPEGPTLMFEDNQSTIALAKNPVPWASKAHRHLSSFCSRTSGKWKHQTGILPNNRHDR